MLVKLALGNVRKSARDYLIYFITIAFSVSLLYAFNTVDTHVDMLPHHRRMIQTIDSLMNMLSYMLIVALAFLIIYANNYLIRRRAKEFALYQIFGMRRRDVATILTMETLFSSLIALVLGLVLGVLLSQFLVFVTGRVLQETVRDYHFVFLPKVILTTVIAYGIIFLLTLILNLFTLRRFQLVDLVKRSRANEVSHLQSKWFALALFVGGVALIGLAYWRLVHIGYPFEVLSYSDSSAIAMAWAKFAVTTVLVCAGTYLLFYSLGGALLYFARASRTVYWRGLNMFTVREFASKIKSSALSMGTISLVLFLMLSVITPAFGVSTSIRKSLYQSAPYSATFILYYDVMATGDIVEPLHNTPVPMDEAPGVLDEKGIFSDVAKTDEGTYSGTFMGEAAHMVLTPAVSTEYITDENGKPLEEKHIVPTMADYIKASGYDTSQWGLGVATEILNFGVSSFDVVPISAYNERRAFAGLEPMTVGEGEYAVAYYFTFSGLRDLYVSALDSGVEIEIAGQTMRPAGGATVALDDSAAAIFMEDFAANNMGTLIVSDSLFAELTSRDDTYEYVYGAISFDDDSRDIFAVESGSQETFEYFIEPFMSEVGTVEIGDGGDGEAGDDTDAMWSIGAATSQVEIAERAIEFLGVVLYISVYVSFILAVMSAAMLAIQILSGVSEAAPRYRRLSQIGASRRDENRSLAVQIALYFFLPLLVGACHAWVAVAQAVDFIELLMPVTIARGVLVTASLVVAIYGIYALVSYWSAKSVIASEANLTER